VLSGFVIYHAVKSKQVSPFVFALHRLARVIPAYWLFTLLTATALVFFPGVVPLTEYTPVFLLKSLSFIPAQNPSGIGFFPLLTVGWTLNYEMAFYVLFFLSLFSPKSIMIFVLILGFFMLQGLLCKFGGGFAFYANNIIYEFLFGVLIAIIYRRGWLHLISPYIASLMVFLSIFFIGSSSGVTHDPIRFGIPCAIVVMAALSLEQYFPKAGIFKRLGDWSYSTYLCHVFVICCVFKISQLFEIGFLPSLIGIIFIVALISFVSYELLERPILKAVKRYG
jgi:exopolysaccharide production protein ExoZ